MHNIAGDHSETIQKDNIGIFACIKKAKIYLVASQAQAIITTFVTTDELPLPLDDLCSNSPTHTYCTLLVTR